MWFLSSAVHSLWGISTCEASKARGQALICILLNVKHWSRMLVQNMAHLQASAHMCRVPSASRLSCRNQPVHPITPFTRSRCTPNNRALSQNSQTTRQRCQHTPSLASHGNSDAYSALSRSPQAQEQQQDMTWATATVTQNRQGVLRGLPYPTPFPQQ